MKRLFYVRHGETELNAAGKWSGQIETPLTENGRSQAKLTGKKLKQAFPRIDLIICSPFSRARHTARIIAEEIGYPIQEIRQSDLLVERSYGALEGTPTQNYLDTSTFKDLDNIEGAETVPQLHERAVQALKYLESLPQANILIVGHGTFGRALRRAVENLPHTHEYLEKHREAYRLGNAEVVELI